MFNKGDIIKVVNEASSNYGKKFKVITAYFDIWDGCDKVRAKNLEHPRSQSIFRSRDIELVEEED